MNSFEIDGRRIGPEFPPYLIAEIGINHGGDVTLAKRLIDEAIEAGADSIKLQAFNTDQFLSRSSPYFDVLNDASLTEEGLGELVRYAADKGVVLFSSVFDEASADTMDGLGAPAFKIASGDITHLPLLRHVGAKGKPVILSTGGSDMGEVEAAVRAIRDGGPNVQIALLHCVSNYPTAPEEVNLACMGTLQAQFDCPVGFSDHTLSDALAVIAVASGACIIEKHFTHDTKANGPDHALSADKDSLKSIAAGMKLAWLAQGGASKTPVEDLDFIKQIRRSLTAAVDIPSGTTITRDMLAIKRPGTGIAPGDAALVPGMTATRNIDADETIHWPDVAR
jgi:N,N'-diacetyllegionaminate synthase